MNAGAQQEIRIAQRQRLALTAHQMLHLMALSPAELADHIDSFAADNPFLTRQSGSRPGPAGVQIDPAAEGPGLFAHVLQSLPLLIRRAADRPLALRLCEALDERGFIIEDLRQIAAQTGSPVLRLEQVLAQLQQIEPVGLFARSVAECLALQLKARGLLDDLAVAVLSRLEQLQSLGPASFARQNRLDPARLEKLLAVVARLDRNPGATLAAHSAPAVLSELVFAKVDGLWQVASAQKRHCQTALRPDEVARALVAAPNPEARRRVQRQWQAAQRLHQMLQMRETTYARLGQALTRRQARGLDSGFALCAPLTQREIAAELGLHASTVCRLVRDRHALVAGRLTPLKAFFERGGARARPQAPSRSALLSQIRGLIADEPPDAPFSDQDLAARLSTPGQQVSRRLVAKYRALVAIPAQRARVRT